MRDVTGFSSCFAVVLFVGFLALVGVIVWKAVASTMRRRRQAFEAVAQRLKGRYSPSRFMTHDRIEFPLAGRTALVEFVSPGEDDQGRTRVVVPLPAPAPGTLHIVPDGFGQSFLKMFGAQDLTIGDREFDGWYVVKAKPESLAGRVFSPDRRARVIASVKRLKGLNTPTIDVTRDQIRVEVREELKGQEPIVQLVNTAEDFLEYLQVVPPLSGIDLGDLKTSKDSTCPVCGTGMAGRVVRCESCSLPHHQECWTYVGQCSTYACKGKRCLA